MAVPRKEKDNILWAEELTVHPLIINIIGSRIFPVKAKD
jgi:hypothetical protein